ncbi:MAG: DUF1385 domain-containing protein [Lachnospiraceae bacterium]|nr:DUF1385 domain-containing protein [Lachnospiraceae bacterium]
MKSSGIGGQAVMEGIMMKNGDTFALAVRLPDGKIQVEPGEYKGFVKGKRLLELPFIRGVFNFIDSMVLGIRTLTRSADIALEAEKAAEAAKKTAGESGEDNSESVVGSSTKDEKKSGDNGLLMALTVVLAIAMAVGLFMVLPVLIASPLKRLGAGTFLITLTEGVIRLVLFFLYVKLISKMEDIQRVFMYHGAEHKCINCIEHGLELNVENVRKSSRLHKRCGTSFLLLVMLVSLLVFMFVRVETVWLRVVSRIVLLPVIAGVSYEVLKLAGRSDAPIIQLISKPGLMMQKLTTKEPDDSMIEVAISAVEAVFDWRKFIEEAKEE